MTEVPKPSNDLSLHDRLNRGAATINIEALRDELIKCADHEERVHVCWGAIGGLLAFTTTAIGPGGTHALVETTMDAILRNYPTPR